MSAMSHVPQRRRRMTVLAADIVGYTRLMEADEEDTHRRAMYLRHTVFAPYIADHGGRIVKHTGDGFLASFDTIQHGVRCAIELQQAASRVGVGDAPDHRIQFRMGVNVCETIVDAEDIFGEGVIVATRLQAYAEPGDVVLTQAVADEVAHQASDPPRFPLGDLILKNLSRPVRAVGLRIGSLGRPAPLAPFRQGDQRPSIVVLPFRTVESDPSDEHIAAGAVDEIVHALGGLRELFVIARASTLAYTGADFDARDIGRQFGVRYVLNGSVRRQGDLLRISTELSETSTGQVLSAGSVEGTRSELFELQARIAVRVLKQIAPQVRERELRRIMRQSPDSLTAYDLTLQALEYLYRMDYASHSQARSLLQRAISDDPDFPTAYTYIAYSLIFRVGEGWSTDPAADTAEALRAANAAIERNRSDALALAIFGHVNAFLLRNFDAARLFLDRAIEAGPNCANAWTLSSAMLGYVGDAEQAIAHAEHGLRLSPLDAHVFWHESLLAQAYYVGGRFEEAVVLARRAADRNNQAVANLRLLTTSLAALGRHAEAAQAAQRLMLAQPSFRLGSYVSLCPFQSPILESWINRLRSAGLPE